MQASQKSGQRRSDDRQKRLFYVSADSADDPEQQLTKRLFLQEPGLAKREFSLMEKEIYHSHVRVDTPTLLLEMKEKIAYFGF